METRVEKYKDYRKEIQESFAESDTTTKMLTSNRVEKIIDEQNNQTINSSDSTTISFDELMNSYQIYDKEQKEEEVSPLINKQKKRIAYIVTSISICSLIAISMLVVFFMHLGGIL